MHRPPPLLPQTFGRYSIERAIAPSGESGVVFRAAMDPGTPRVRPVALAVLDPSAMPHRQALEQRWARAANASHPALLGPLDFGRQQGLLYVATPWLEGIGFGDLLRALDRDDASRTRVVASVGVAIAEALGTLAPERGEAELVHGTLTPSRIMVLTSGHIKLLGYPGRPDEVAPGIDPSDPTTGAWLAPEQHRGAPPSGAADVYATALLLKSLAGAPDHALDPDLDEILSEALAPDPTRRPASARWLATKLQFLLRAHGGPLQPSDWRVILDDLELQPTAPLEVDDVPRARPLLEAMSARTPAAAPPPAGGLPARSTADRGLVAGLVLACLAGAAVSLGVHALRVGGDEPAPELARAVVPRAEAPTHEVHAPPPEAPPTPTAPTPEARERPPVAASIAPAPRPSPAAAAPTLTVDSAPAGVVYIGGLPVGTTPLVDHALAAGTAEVEVRLGGHVTARRTLDLEAGAHEEWRPTLERKGEAGPAVVHVTSSPAGVVYIDDEPVGTSPLSGHTLPEGRHVIEVRLGGYHSARREVELRPGAAVDVVLELQSAAPGGP